MHQQLLEVYSQNVNDNLAFIYFINLINDCLQTDYLDYIKKIVNKNIFC